MRRVSCVLWVKKLIRPVPLKKPPSKGVSISSEFSMIASRKAPDTPKAAASLGVATPM